MSTKTINIGGVDYRQKIEDTKEEKMTESIEGSPASRADVIKLSDELHEIKKAVGDIQKDIPDATNSIGQIMERLDELEERVGEIMESAHDHQEGDGQLSHSMKYAVLDFLKEVDGLCAVDEEFATNPDGTPKKSKKKDVRNQTAMGAEVDLNTEDPEEADKMAHLEAKIDALMKSGNQAFYRGTDIEKETGGSGSYLGSVIAAGFKNGGN